MLGKGFGVALGLALGVLLVMNRADACSMASPEVHQIDPAEQAVDTTPPSALGETTASVRRGRGPETSGCSETTTSCDDIGTVAIHLGAVSDDRTDEAEMGFRVELIDGALPSGLVLPSGDVRASPDGSLTLGWSDGASDDQEAFDFTLRVSAVDRAGNVGPGSDVRVRHGGGSSDGCEIAAGSRVDLSWVLLLLALGALWRGLPHTARRARV